MKICGTHKFSILQISDAVMSLGIPHLIYRSHTERFKVLKRRVGEGKARILIVDGLRSIRKRQGLVIVSAPMAELARTNMHQLDGDDLAAEIEASMELEHIDLTIRDIPIMEFVNTAVKPSYLMGVQTAIYQISNPIVRKSTQQAILQFLDSRISFACLVKLLKNNFHSEPLIPLVSHKTATDLREAVARYRQGEDILIIELQTKLASFDILYVARSADARDKLEKAKSC